MLVSDVGLTNKQNVTDVSKLSSEIILDSEFHHILEAIKFGRNIYENLRKFIQYQAIISWNLAMYIFIGSLLYRDWPIQPALVLFINFLMDTFASVLLASELP